MPAASYRLAVRVFLTGAVGFVGSWTVPALVARDCEVRALVRDEAKATSVLARRGVEGGGVELVLGDMLDEEVVSRGQRGATPRSTSPPRSG